MKNQLILLFQKTAEKLVDQGIIPQETQLPDIQISIPKERKFGDYSLNLAMILAKKVGLPPRELAAKLIELLGDGDGMIAEVEIAGPGFINVFINPAGMFEVLKKIDSQGDDYGKTNAGRGRKVQVEFVSANPTGPLHVGHGRNAVYGDTLTAIMQAAGYDTYKEYYINDAGFQILTLGKSTFLRYRELLGEKIEIPKGYYVGDYLVEVANRLRDKKGDGLTEEDVPDIAFFAANEILGMIREDCANVGVLFDNWFSETTLHESNRIDQTLEKLKREKLAYEKEGALWFETTRYGDDKDRVLVKSDAQKTYFAADVAYHADKFDRGFDLAINVWGADHHGYIPRMKAAVTAMGRDPEDLDILLIQLVTLTRGGEVQQMSTRSGQFVPLSELVQEVGKDALRYFYLMRRHDAQLEFDIDLALEQSNKNPVFYVQYMHARICSIFAKAEKLSIEVPGANEADLSKLGLPEEMELARHLAEFPQMVVNAAIHREPHRLIGYMYDLATMFHHYYHHNRVISDDPAQTGARLALCKTARQVLKNALSLAGINAPVTM